MIRPEQFITYSIEKADVGQQVIEILMAALEAVEPAAAVTQFMKRDGDILYIKKEPYNLTEFRRVILVGAGKAGVPMAEAAVEVLGPFLKAGAVVVKEGHTGGKKNIGPVEIYEAGHPVPDERGIFGTKKVIELVSDLTEFDLVIVLISGGGSALLTQPADGLQLADMQVLTNQLLACGATIHEINTLRKHLDKVKGGGLARRAAPARMVTLILSDVVGNLLDVIASGPTVPDPSTFHDALQILVTYDLLDKVPVAIRTHLEMGERGDIDETPKAKDKVFSKIQNILVGSNQQAAKAAIKKAREIGFRAQLLTTSLEGEAREKGRWLGSVARRIALTGFPLGPPACLVAGGETTVTLHGTGQGGRNQELALAAVEEVAGIPNIMLITLATDGGDGPTDAAGAVVTGDTMGRAEVLGLDPRQYLDQNDSYHFFYQLGDLLHPGPTQTNVNDLVFVFVFL